MLTFTTSIQNFTGVSSQRNDKKMHKDSMRYCLALPIQRIVFWTELLCPHIPDHLICLLRNLYAGQEATVRTGYGTTDWFQIGKGGRQGCILSPCLFNFYAEYIMRNAGLEETQAGIKIARRNINNLRYALTPPLWQKVKRNSKASWWKWKWRVKKLA